MNRSFGITFLNNTLNTLSDISVKFCESFYKSPENLIETDDFFCDEVQLEHHKLKEMKCVSSLQSVELLNEVEHQHWQIWVSYKGIFYESRTKKIPWVNFDLDFKTSDSILVISINEKSTDILQVNFKFGTKEKSFDMEKLKSITDQTNECKKLKQRFIERQLVPKFLKLHQDFTNNLDDLKNVMNCRKNDPEADDENILFNFFSGDLENLLNEGSEKVHSKKKTLYGNVVSVREELKQNWSDITDTIKNLKNSLKYLEKKTIQNKINNDGQSINLTFEVVDLFDSMPVTHILCELLEIVGCTEDFLVLKPTCLEDSIYIMTRFSKLITTMREEFSLWNGKNKLWNELDLANRLNQNELTPDEVQSTRVYSLVKCSKLFDIVRTELIKRLDKVSKEINQTNRNVGISTLTSASVGIVGGSLTVTGLLLAPVTAGVSTVLVAVGTTLAATGGAVGIGSNIADAVLTNKFLQSTVDLTSMDKKLCNSMICLKNIIDKYKMFRGSNLTDANKLEGRNVVDNTLNGAMNAGATAFKITAQIAKVGLFRMSFAAMGIVIDVITIFNRSINLARGGKSEIGEKVKKQSEILNREQSNILKWIEQLRAD